jgi:glycerate kinase
MRGWRILKKIVIVPDSFKGTMTSIEVSNIIENGIKHIRPEIETIKIPIADGGEGTVDAFLCALGGKKVMMRVKGPCFEEVDAFYGILPDGQTAVIEMAAASGLPLVGDKKDPCNTTTYGTGQLIRDALDKGCKKIIIGVGGSATNDGGIGMAAALGIKFLNKDNEQILLTGGGLSEFDHMDLAGKDSRLEECLIEVACDVDNPLYGKEGAAYVFAPQKGADEKMVELLDQNLKHYAGILSRDLGIQVQNIPGAGAAGGLGAGLLAFLNAKLLPGIQIILDTVGFDEMIKDADLIITGEGKIDGQSLRGKVPIGIAQRARKQKVPVMAIVGAIGNGIEEIYSNGIHAVFSINKEPLPFEIAKDYSKENLLYTTESLMRFATVLTC